METIGENTRKQTYSCTNTHTHMHMCVLSHGYSDVNNSEILNYNLQIWVQIFHVFYQIKFKMQINYRFRRGITCITCGYSDLRL